MCAIFGLQGYLQELILQHTFQNRFAFFVTALQCGTLAALAVAQLAAACARPPPQSVCDGPPSLTCGCQLSVRPLWVEQPRAAQVRRADAAPLLPAALGAARLRPGPHQPRSAVPQLPHQGALHRSQDQPSLPHDDQVLCRTAQVVFKSSKPAMVMLYSALLLRKSYGARDYCAVLAMVVGLALFVLGDTQATYNHPHRHPHTDHHPPGRYAPCATADARAWRAQAQVRLAGRAARDACPRA